MKHFNCYETVGNTTGLIWCHWRDQQAALGKLLWKWVDNNRIVWHEKSAKKPQQTCQVNKSHSKPNCFETFGSARIDLALNKRLRLISAFTMLKIG